MGKAVQRKIFFCYSVFTYCTCSMLITGSLVPVRAQPEMTSSWYNFALRVEYSSAVAHNRLTDAAYNRGADNLRVWSHSGGIFSRDGLSRLWNELVKDGELVDETLFRQRWVRLSNMIPLPWYRNGR